MTTPGSHTQIDYKNRINTVFQFIDDNLDSQLSLHNLAEIAHFSPYHFHRIFKLITGETLNTYITRRKIEKSALDVLHKNIPITEIAHTYGFSEHAAFTRTFKRFYGVSPTAFRKQNPYKFSKIRQLLRKKGQVYPDRELYICVLTNLKNWISMNANIEIKQLPEMNVAYVSSIGDQTLEKAYQTLMQWAAPQGLMCGQTKMITIYHDSFKVTEAHKVRLSACILLDKPVKTAGEIGLTNIEAGKYVVGSFEIGLDEFEKSWTGLFVWMNEKGYKKADKNPFEVYHNNFNEHPEKKARVDFCIPME